MTIPAARLEAVPFPVLANFGFEFFNCHLQAAIGTRKSKFLL
jgi:hypothetical protein